MKPTRMVVRWDHGYDVGAGKIWTDKYPIGTRLVGLHYPLCRPPYFVDLEVEKAAPDDSYSAFVSFADASRLGLDYIDTLTLVPDSSWARLAIKRILGTLSDEERDVIHNAIFEDADQEGAVLYAAAMAGFSEPKGDG